MMYVYILRSQKYPARNYIGLTSDLKRRIQEHNGGLSTYTKQYLPWKIETALWFMDAAKAARFEKYLKSHSGLAFRNRHF
jgi:predicted GIY-YIG superfamily endonuclease